jgi:glutamyl-tRNA synthetase
MARQKTEPNTAAPAFDRTGRFAPSPTGPLHIGNLRTALLAWLFARSVRARFLVRVEDLDRSRVRPGIAEAQLADLQAIGLDWDGPVARQSERMGLYEEAVARLDAGGLLYPCYCTRKEIRAAVSAPHGILAADRYPGTCRELTKAERAEREAAGRPPALRVRAEGARISFEDRILGHQDGETDDFVLRRNDGAPAYQLAVVVDDADQGIGEVVRGADLGGLDPAPDPTGPVAGPAGTRYAHVPLVLGPDGRRLAKRHGAVTLEDLAAQGEGPGKCWRGWPARWAWPDQGEASHRGPARPLRPRKLSREPTFWGPGT